VGALGARALAAALGLLAAGACSPEARRVRDGGPGADPGNKVLVPRLRVEPQAADTTLWPGRAPAPVEQLVRGPVPPPTYPAHQRTFEHGDRADPRRPSGTAE
jgi:hypothetical protein